MKKNIIKVLTSCITAMSLILLQGSSALGKEDDTYKKEYKNVGYVFQRNCDIDKLDVTKITHLNYSFGLIYNNEYKEINQATGTIFGTPSNPDVRTPEPVPEGKLHTIYLPDKVKSDLSRMDELRAKNPNLKILLSVGGFDARGFSDAASTEESRKIFANSCKETIEEYNLDGIDLDWEYPVNGGWGSIKAIPEDKENFTLLLKEVRNSIGNNKLLSIAGSANLDFTGVWTDFQSIIPILDYINIMTYDFQYDSNYFGSALYKSKEWDPGDSAGYWCDKAVRNYLDKGCPAEKINLGLAFAAPIPQIARTSSNYSEVRNRLNAAGWNSIKEPTLKKVRDLLEDKNGFKKEWDEDAMMSYISTEIQGEKTFVLSYIEPKGLSAKLNYVKELNLGGTMFWEFSSDYDNSLVTQIAEELNINSSNTSYTDTKDATNSNSKGTFATNEDTSITNVGVTTAGSSPKTSDPSNLGELFIASVISGLALKKSKKCKVRNL